MSDLRETRHLADTLSDSVYRFVRENLRCGVYKPGDKITHRTVASQLNVSVTPVREAITRLVSEESLSMIGPKTIVAPRLQSPEFEEITKIRIKLEGWAAELAAKNVTASFIDDLERRHLEYCAHRRSHDAEAKMAANAKFHFSLYAQSMAPKLLSIIDNLWVSNGPTLGLLANKSSDDGDGQRFHEAAISALRKGDSQAVRQAIIDDIVAGRSKILRLLDNASR